MSDQGMTTIALGVAKEHVYNVCQGGHVITLVRSSTKDEFGEGLSEIIQELHSHPCRPAPFDREIVGKISWAENVDYIFYVALKEVDELDLTLKKLKRFKKVRHENIEYEIKYIEYYSSFLNSFLYVIIGGAK